MIKDGKMKKELILLIVLTLTIFLVGCTKQVRESAVIPSHAIENVVEPEVINEPEELDVPTEEDSEIIEDPVVEELPEMSMELQQSKARNISREYIENMAGYTEYNGREINIRIPVYAGCEGCFLIDASFNRDDPKLENKTDGVKIHLDIKDWKVDSYTFK